MQSGVWETPYIWKESKTNDAKYNPIYSELFEASIFRNISVDGGFWMVLDGFGLSVCVSRSFDLLSVASPLASPKVAGMDQPDNHNALADLCQSF